MIKESNRDANEATDSINYDPSMNIKVENFRPNIIVSGTDQEANIAHEEDGWSQLDVNLQSSSSTSSTPTVKVTLDVTGPCARCSMVNVNGQSGIMDCRVFEALKGYRKHESSVYFGQFLSYKSHEEPVVETAVANQQEYYFISVGSEILITPRS